MTGPDIPNADEYACLPDCRLEPFFQFFICVQILCRAKHSGVAPDRIPEPGVPHALPMVTDAILVDTDCLFRLGLARLHTLMQRQEFLDVVGVDQPAPHRVVRVIHLAVIFQMPARVDDNRPAAPCLRIVHPRLKIGMLDSRPHHFLTFM